MQLHFDRELGAPDISASAEVLLATARVFPSRSWSQHLALHVLGHARLSLAVCRGKGLVSDGRSRAFLEGGSMDRQKCVSIMKSKPNGLMFILKS